MTIQIKLVFGFLLAWVITCVGVLISFDRSGLDEMIRPVILILASGGIAGLLATLFFANLAIRPFLKLKRAMDRFESGKTDVELEACGDRDSVEIARGFNSMVHAIQSKSSSAHASGEKLKAIMDTLIEPVYLVSHDHVIEFMNKAMIRKIGHDAAGESCYAVFRNISSPCPECMLDHLEWNRPKENDAVLLPDKRSYHVTYTAIPHVNRPDSMMAVYRDVSEITALQAQLAQAQKLEAIGTLAGGIAHDFNNILFPITGHAEMLLDEFEKGSSTRESIEIILSGAERAKELVKQILVFCRETEDEMQPLSIQLVIKETLKLLRASLPATIHLVQKIRNDCDLVRSDPSQIHQIVMHLCTNAFQSIPEGKGTLTVSLTQEALARDDLPSTNAVPGDYVCLSVADTGVGMTQAVIDRIYHPFFTTKEVGKGKGLGLSVVHGIVKKLGGFITIVSEPGKGTDFKVFFPVIPTQEEEPDSNGNRKDFYGNERILVVDDEADIVAMLKEVLQKAGYQVTGRTVSTEALADFQNNPDVFDLVITDKTMPELTGDELAMEFLKIRPDLPVVLMTGFSDTMTQTALNKNGIKGLLMKPVSKKDLMLMIKQVIDEGK